MTTLSTHAQIFIDDYINGAISEYNFDGTLIHYGLAQNTGYAAGMVEENGILYLPVGNGSGGGSVQAFTLSGSTVSSSLTPGVVHPISMAIGGNGNLYVLDFSNGKIGEYTTSGATVNASLAATSLFDGVALTVDSSSGNIFVANYSSNSVSEFSSTGTLLNTALINGLNHPYGLSIYDGNLYVSNSGSGVIGEYTLSGTTINASLITGLVQPYGMSFANGDLYVANRGASVNAGYIGVYDAITGATINADLISGGMTPNGVVVIAAVPEPATWVLVFLGLGGVIVWRRSKIALR